MRKKSYYKQQHIYNRYNGYSSRNISLKVALKSPLDILEWSDLAYRSSVYFSDRRDVYKTTVDII